MALFDETEPPSLSNREKENTKILPELKNKHQFNIFSKLFQASKPLGTALGAMNNFFVGVKDFSISGKYLPHVVVAILGLIVGVTNLTQKYAAKAYFEEIVTVNPDTKYAVTLSLDPYIPMVENAPELVHKNILASNIADGFATATGSVSTEQTVEEPSVLDANEGKTIEIVVSDGDTLSGLGMRYDVKLATLKYVNNIDNENLIRPGSKLKIPPKNYEVSAKLIAQREKKLALARNTVTRSGSRVSGRASSVRTKPGTKINGYPYGWCTYYVATRRYVPTGWGNARSWLSSARRAGYATGSEPASGSIVVTSESGWGHVAYVESVNGDSITISEMNYEGWGVISRRTISANGGVVRGFVY